MQGGGAGQGARRKGGGEGQAALWGVTTSTSTSSQGLNAMQNVEVMPNGRMPQAPASLLVQLPPDELKRMLAEQHQRGGPVGTSTTPAPAMSSIALQQQTVAAAARMGLADHPSVSRQGGASFQQQQPVQPSDVALLAASLQERREREARVFIWQQRLIGGVSVDRTMLKRALTQLSLPAWLQVLQERHLAHRCAHPTCDRTPKKPHPSHDRSSVLPLDAPRYRISLRRRAIERDERDDAGGEHGFCGAACWRRGEWISRWILNGGASTRQARHAVSSESKQAFGAEGGSAIRPAKQGYEDTAADDGGRWERIMDESYWTEIELLEDLEDRGEVDRLDDGVAEGRDTHMGSTASDEKAHNTVPSSMTLPPIVTSAEVDDEEVESSIAATLPEQGDDILCGQPTALARDHAQKRAAQDGVGVAEGFLDMLDSLEIRERQDGKLLGNIAEMGERSRGVAEMESLPETEANAHTGDVSMSAREPDGGKGDDDDDGPGSEKKRQQQQQQRREEDDLFAQAWAAMDEEKAKGMWEA